MRQIALIAVDVRSAHNVGAMLRTADAMGVSKVYAVGITPYPSLPGDKRLPHVRVRADWQIHKTALGAEKSLKIEHRELAELKALIQRLRQDGFEVVALEQAAGAVELGRYQPGSRLALMVGNEIRGLSQPALALADKKLAIPMLGVKESLNVAVAAGIALYELRHSG